MVEVSQVLVLAGRREKTGEEGESGRVADNMPKPGSTLGISPQEPPQIPEALQHPVFYTGSSDP